MEQSDNNTTLEEPPVIEDILDEIYIHCEDIPVVVKRYRGYVTRPLHKCKPKEVIAYIRDKVRTATPPTVVIKDAKS